MEIIVVMFKYVVLWMKRYLFECCHQGVEMASGKLLCKGDKMMGGKPAVSCHPFQLD